MNIVIFAGGAGQRLWPISRQRSPKQFERLQGDKSTLEMAVDRVVSFGLDHLFVSTNERYVSLIEEQVKGIPPSHIYAEPARRDLGAAVLLTLLRMKQQGITGSIGMLWSDHFMDRPDAFLAALKKGESLLEENPHRFIFLGERPRFANHNLGWIHMGSEIAPGVHAFQSWKYRPEVEACKEMFSSGEWLWNPGYFLFDIDFVLGLYKLHQKELFDTVSDLVAHPEKLATEYEKLPALSFDNAIVEKTDPSQAVVLPVDLGWSDPGTLYALKEALAPKEEDNFTKGLVLAHETRDSFIFNEDKEKLITTIGLDGIMVINTKDALLVCPKDRVPEIKALLKRIEEEGLSQYL